MSGRSRRADGRIASTVAFIRRCPGSSVPEAMRACKFSLAESLDRGKQMVIRRAVAKGSNVQLMPPPHVIEASMMAGTSTVSPLTNQTPVAVGGRSQTSSNPPSTATTTATTSPIMVPKPTMKVTRRTAGAMHKFRVNRLATSDHGKCALKRATKWYAEEKKNKWIVIGSDCGKGEEGVRWCWAAPCHNSSLCQRKSGWHVTIEARGYG